MTPYKKTINDLIIDDKLFAIDNDNNLHIFSIIEINLNVYNNKPQITIRDIETNINRIILVDGNKSIFESELLIYNDDIPNYIQYIFAINKQDMYDILNNKKYNIHKSIQKLDNI